MRLRNFYHPKSNSKKTNTDYQALKGKGLFVTGIFCMLFNLLSVNTSQAQAVTRTSTVIAGTSPFQDSLWTVNLADYTIVKHIQPTLAGFTITGINGLATHPFTGEHYCILKLASVSGRVLAKINIQTGICTQIGNLGDNFSTLAFNANGTLFGVTGNSTTSLPTETMYRINTTTAATTFFRTLGNGDDGEVIAYNTDDHKFYHWSGNTTVVFERFDTTGVDAIEPLTFSGIGSGEVFGALYMGGGQMLVSNIASEWRMWTISGTSATVGSPVFNGPDDLRGLVRESHTTIIDPGGPLAICSGSNVSLMVVNGTGGYQWYMNGSPISGATNDTYVATAAGVYNSVYADINGIIDSPSSGIVVTYIENPAITLAAHPQVCYGATGTGISFSTNSNFSYSGSSNSYYVPWGVTSVNFDIMGAGGGNDTGAFPNPGMGGRLQGTLSVNPGDVLTVNIGGAGSTGTLTGAMGGFNGGGNSWGFGGSGGGATDIRINGTSLAQRVAVAGGGAGSGNDGISSVMGGFGGSTTGGNGEFNADGSQAMGGSASAGGTGATFTGFLPGDDGMLGAGGAGSINGVSGGGGGGFYGGGGGAWSGGGGGSSYADALLVTSETHTAAANAGNGAASISFGIPASYSYIIDWDGAAEAAGFTDVAPSSFPTSSSFPISIPGTATPDTYNGTLIISNGTCSYSEPISVTIKPIPDVNATADQTPVCNGASTTDVNFTGSLSGTNFDWTNDLGTVGIPASGSGDILSFTAINGTSANQVAQIIVTPELNGCYGTADTFTYTVKPTPMLNITSAGYVCDNTVFTYSASSTTSGTTFSWTRDALAGDVVAPAASGVATISETFDNTGANPYAISYTYTLTAAGCENTQFVTVTVNPTPTLNPTPLVGTICSGDAFTHVQNSMTGGVVYSWSRAAVTGISTPASSGTGDINEVLTSTVATSVTVTYIDTLNINGCKYTEPVSVVVNPMPVLTTAVSDSVCDNSVFDYNPAANVAGTTITWSRAFVSGIANSGTSSAFDTVNETLDNTTDDPIFVTYVFSMSANGCTNTQNFQLLVNPTPMLNTTLTPASVCDSTSFFDYIPGSNTANTTFSWSRAAVPNITNPAATGTGNPHERLRNAATFIVPVTYVYTLRINGCANAQNVVVNVNPRPKLSNTPMPPTPICDSTVFTFVPSSATLGYSYMWSRAFVAGIGALPSSGTGNINERLKNNTNTNVTVTYVFTVTANGCDRVQSVPLLVHPTPKISSHLSDSACSGAPYMYTPRTDLTPAVTYAWNRATVPNVTPATGNGTGNINETLVNGSTANINVPYTYTITVAGSTCSKTHILNVKLRPSAEVPVISVMPATTLCNGTMYQNFGAATPAAPGNSYTWSATNAEVYATGAGNQYSLVNFNNPGTAVVTLSSTIGATGCVGIATYTVTVGNAAAQTLASVIYTRGKFICLQNDVKSFQWGYDDKNTLDSVILKGENNQSYFNSTPETASRNYWVITVSADGSCSKKSYYNKPNDNTPKDIYNDMEDGITDMKVFPNPANDQVNVEVMTQLQGAVRVDLMNMLGQTLSSVNSDNNKASFNINNLAAGFYMIDCYQNGLKIGTAKFVKN